MGPPPGREWWPRANDVSVPTMTMYPPTAPNTGAAMVVFPGGGYQFLAMDLEGTEACDWLVSRGITCVLLKYRVPGSGPWWDSEHDRRVYPKVQTALQDAQRTLGLVRLHAAEWHVDPRKVGVIGFSYHEGKPPELGYWLGEPHWGQGIMTEAGRALIEAAHPTHQYDLIVARALADNAGSLNVLEKLGFKRKGKAKSEASANFGKPIVLLELQRPRWM